MRGRDDPDRRIAEFAGVYHGVVSRNELSALGIGTKAIDYRLKVGRLQRLYLGVYAVGHRALTREGRWRAATLAGGDDAVLSHGHAAALWGLVAPPSGRYDVSIPSRGGRRPSKDIRLHRIGTLAAEEVTTFERIPVTTVARTLLDLARTVKGRRLEDAIAQADRLQLFDLRAIVTVLDRHARQPGAPELRGVLGRLAGSGPADLRSPAEVAFLQLCDDFGLPAPAANVVVEGFLVDFHWPGTSLVVEVDGYRFHRTPTAFDRDRDRDQVLAVAGYTVARFTKRQLDRSRRRCAERVAALLKRCGAPGPQ